MPDAQSLSMPDALSAPVPAAPISQDFPPPPPGVPPPAPDPNRPSWLAEGMPMSAEPSPAFAGVAYTPVAETPMWEAPAPARSPVTVVQTALVWGGVLLGAAVLLFGLLGVAAAPGEPAGEGARTMPIAIAFAVAGAVLCAVFLLKVFGYSINVGAPRLAIGSLGVVGSIILGLMVLNTYIALTQPVGSGRYGIPLGTIAIMVRRALMGRWLAVFILGGAWIACVGLIQARGGP